jgi:hypothetical protein
MKVLSLLVLVAPCLAFSPLQKIQQQQRSTRLEMMDRREAITFAGAALLFPAAANAEAFIKGNEPSDYEIVKEQRQTTDKLDVNNAPVGK